MSSHLGNHRTALFVSVVLSCLGSTFSLQGESGHVLWDQLSPLGNFQNVFCCFFPTWINFPDNGENFPFPWQSSASSLYSKWGSAVSFYWFPCTPVTAMVCEANVVREHTGTCNFLDQWLPVIKVFEKTSENNHLCSKLITRRVNFYS